MYLPTVIISNLLFFILPTTAQDTSTANSTVSLWLPWLPNALHQNLDASAINAQPTVTTYAIACPISSSSAILPKRASTPEPACIINGPLPQTVTAGSTTVIMTRSNTNNGNYESWGCKLGGTTSGSCAIHSTWTQITLAGNTQGPGQVEKSSSYTGNSLVFRPVTVTAGSSTVNAPVEYTLPTGSVSSILALTSITNLSATATGAGYGNSVLAPVTDSSILSQITASADASESATGSKVSSSAPTTTISASTTMTASSTETTTSASPAQATKNAASAVREGSQGSMFALAVAMLGLVLGMA